MRIQIAYSCNPAPEGAARELYEKLKLANAKLVIFFASPQYDPFEISRHMKKNFPHALLMGCSTAGEIISGQMLKGSIVGLALGSDIVGQVKIEVLENITENLQASVNKAFLNFEKYFNCPTLEMSGERYAGLEFVDGLSGMEEPLIGYVNRVSSIPFVGGSAGDDERFKQTYVFCDGSAYTNAALLCIIKPLVEFTVFKTQSFDILYQTLVATKVDSTKRLVLEFNHQPAVEAYAKALGIPSTHIGDYFMTNPLGLVISGDPYVLSPKKVEGTGIYFYCRVEENMSLNILRSEDIIKTTLRTIEQQKKRLGDISCMINFNCILRTLQLAKEGITQSYADLFLDIPTVGFNTYGEQYKRHINQTATLLAFGTKKPSEL